LCHSLCFGGGGTWPPEQVTNHALRHRLPPATGHEARRALPRRAAVASRRCRGAAWILEASADDSAPPPPACPVARRQRVRGGTRSGNVPPGSTAAPRGGSRGACARLCPQGRRRIGPRATGTCGRARGGVAGPPCATIRLVDAAGRSGSVGAAVAAGGAQLPPAFPPVHAGTPREPPRRSSRGPRHERGPSGLPPDFYLCLGTAPAACLSTFASMGGLPAPRSGCGSSVADATVGARHRPPARGQVPVTLTREVHKGRRQPPTGVRGQRRGGP